MSVKTFLTGLARSHPTERFADALAKADREEIEGTWEFQVMRAAHEDLVREIDLDVIKTLLGADGND